MQARASRFFDGWALKSLLVNASAAALDWGTVFLLVAALELPTAVGTCTGIALGATFSFIMNRKFAFRAQATGSLGGQVLRYAVGIGVLMLLHALAATYLIDKVGLPLAVGKIICDVGILAGGQLLMLRYFVFPQPKQKRLKPLPEPATV